MIKMIIEMDNEKINLSDAYTTDQIYSALDRIFKKRGMDRVDTDRGIEYLGHNLNTDFAQFGKIMLGLKEQNWFMDNAVTWLYCNSDDSDDPDDFDEEDLLVHYGKKAVA